MLQSFIIDFLTDLKANNNREWFAEHKADYTQAKDSFEAFNSSTTAFRCKFCPSENQRYPISHLQGCAFFAK